MSAENIARAFHESYERLAPEHGYETREASAKPWVEVPEQNKALMVAVAGDLLASGVVVEPAGVEQMRTIVAALAIYGEDANLPALVEKARALNQAAPAGNRVEVYQDEGGDYRWRLVAANGQVVGRSEEGYTERAYTLHRAQMLNPDAKLDDLTRPPEPEPTMDDLAAAEADGVDVEQEAVIPAAPPEGDRGWGSPPRSSRRCRPRRRGRSGTRSSAGRGRRAS